MQDSTDRSRQRTTCSAKRWKAVRTVLYLLLANLGNLFTPPKIFSSKISDKKKAKKIRRSGGDSVSGNLVSKRYQPGWDVSKRGMFNDYDLISGGNGFNGVVYMYKRHNPQPSEYYLSDDDFYM